MAITSFESVMLHTHQLARSNKVVTNNLTGSQNALARVVRPTLIAAIGGTGTAAVRFAKARMEQYLDSKRHFVALRAFDTDSQDDQSPRLVNNSEFVYLGGFNAQAVCQDVIEGRGFSHLSQWLPPWLDFHQVACGAGGIRPIGRLCYFYRRDRIEASIREALTSIRDSDLALRHFKETGVQVNIDAGIDIHLICSLCGGTGSGMFLDMAFDLRRWAKEFTDKEVTVTGHLVLPEAFRNRPVVMRSLEANCYAALQELDHYMNVESRQAWRVEYQPGNLQVSEHLPFDYCYLLSGSQQGGSMDVTGLTSMIGESLFLFSSTEVGQRVLAGAINTSAQRRGTRDAQGRVCCYSSYGMLGMEIPLELLGRALGSELARDARHRILQPAPQQDREMDAQIDALLPSIGLTTDASERFVPSLKLDLAPIIIMFNSKQENVARAMLTEHLLLMRADLQQRAKQQAALPLCDVKDLRAALRKGLLELMPQPSGFDRSLNFLKGVSGRLQTLRESLLGAVLEAKGEAEKHRIRAEAIERQGVAKVENIDAELGAWRQAAQIEARQIVLEGQALNLSSFLDEVRHLITRWQKIRTMFDHLRMERPLTEDSYYALRRSRASVCPVEWFNKLLEPFRDDMIHRVLAALVGEYDTWSNFSAGELSSRFFAICANTMQEHFAAEAGMNCDQLLADCYGYPGDRYREIVASLLSRARASWEIHESYPLRDSTLEVSAIGAVTDSHLYKAVQETHRDLTPVGSQWSDFVPILRTEHIMSLTGLKRLPSYRQSFMDSINLEQRYDLHFFLDRRWVSELVFPDEGLGELDDYRRFTLSEAVGAIKNLDGGYVFVAGRMRVPLNTYRHMAFEYFRQNYDLNKRADNRIARSGVLFSKDKLESHIGKLRNKIDRASNGSNGTNGTNGSNGRSSHGRPTSREVQQVHQEIRAVLAALKNGDGAL